MIFDVLKKNRKYFAATKDGYKCKILIDENSQGLELGEQTLAVDDISKKSKYGTELIYKLSVDAETQKSAGIVTLESKYNVELVKKCRELGGTWDKTSGLWIFPEFVESEVEELDAIYNSELVTVKITLVDGLYGEQGPATLLGYVIARAFDRDSDAVLGDGVALLSGTVSGGGSRKNWKTVVSVGAVIKLQIPRDLLSRLENWEEVK